MKRSTIAGLVALAGGAGFVPLMSASGAEALRVDGEIEAVTVYRGQALVTRSLEFDLEPGVHELVVGDLPTHIVEGSLHAESESGVNIRSVRYREQPVREDVREEVRELDDALEGLRDELARLDRRAETIAARKDYVKNLESFTTQNAMAELSKGVLDAATLKELSEFIFAQQEEIETREIELRSEREQVQSDIEQIEREKQAIGARSTRTARDAIVTIDVQDEGMHELSLRYLVDRATWDPSHTVRGDIDDRELVVEYFASIQQTSGEDWGDVEMRLSTATPSLVARAPQFTALRLGLAPTGAQQMRQSAVGVRDELIRSQVAAIKSRNANTAVFVNSQSASDNFELLDSSLNRIAIDYQLLELRSGDVIARAAEQSPDSAGHTVTYTIPGKTALPSRPERQQIQIASMPLDGDFYKVAIPLLTSFVYEEARATNTSSNVLLAGPVTTYADGQFVGYSMFDDIAMGEEMIVGLGINSDLRSERVVVAQEESVVGGNRVVELTIRLSVQNFGDEDTTVRLMDRLPQVDPEQVQLTVEDDGAASSQFVEDSRATRHDGEISWILNVPAKAIADSAASVTYTLRIAHDRQMNLVGSNR